MRILRLPSNPNIVSQLDKYVKELDETFDLNEKFPDILISLTEAVNNAIIHGNNLDESKNVEIKVQTIKKGLLFIVKDEGRGFDKGDLCDPTCQENLDKIGGRGVFIMDQLCDELTFHHNGSVVKMFFKL